MSNKRSVIEVLGLPKEFGITILCASFVLTLTSWLGDTDLDFGIFKVPRMPPKTQHVLRFIGPISLVSAIAIHVPLLAPPKDKDADSDTNASLVKSLERLTFITDHPENVRLLQKYLEAKGTTFSILKTQEVKNITITQPDIIIVGSDTADFWALPDPR